MQKITNIYCADFESNTIHTNFYKKHNDSIVYLGYMKNFRDENEDYKFTSIVDFYFILRQWKKSAIIYFHNLAWDGYFIYKYLLKQNIKWYNKIPPKATGFSLMRNGTKIYKLTFKFYNGKKYITIHFRCSLRMLSSSIATLGESFGMQKHKEGDAEEFYDNEPFLKWEQYPKRFLDYTLDDVNIMRLALLEFDRAINTLQLMTKEKNRTIDWLNALTIGGLGIKIQKNYIRNYSNYLLNTDEIFKGAAISSASYELAQKFFYGGWVQFNPLIQRITYKVNGKSIDLNSAHPNSMTKLLPYGDIYEGDPPDDIKDYLIYYEIKVKQAIQIYPEVTNLLNWNKRHKTNKNDFEAFNRYTKIQNNFTCYYLKEEWEMLQNFYMFSGVKIVKKYWCKAAKFLEDYVRDVYKLRLAHKEKKEIAMSNCYKILLNASYGKWATRQKFTQEYICTHTQADYLIKLKNVKLELNGKVKNWIVLSKSEMFSTPEYAVLILEEDIVKNRNFNKWIAATVTAYTRITQWQAILDTGPKNFLYGDTDSLFIKNCTLKKLNLHPTELGAWDVESEFSYFRVNGAKTYLLLDKDKKPIPNKAKYSGINTHWLKKNISLDIYDTMESTLKDANTRPIYLKSGIVIVKKDYTPSKRTL